MVHLFEFNFSLSAYNQAIFEAWATFLRVSLGFLWRNGIEGLLHGISVSSNRRRAFGPDDLNKENNNNKLLHLRLQNFLVWNHECWRQTN